MSDVLPDKGSLQVSGADRADLEWVRQCAEMRSDSDVLIRGAAGEEVFNIGDLRELIGIALSSPSSTNALLPGFVRTRIEQAIEEAIHPKGMSTHNGMARVQAADIQRMLAIIDRALPSAINTTELRTVLMDARYALEAGYTKRTKPELFAAIDAALSLPPERKSP